MFGSLRKSLERTTLLVVLIAIILTAIFLAIAYLATTNYYVRAHTTEYTEGDEPEDNLPEIPGPLFVVPESPLGTLGLISALAAGFAIYTIIKKSR